MQKEDLFVSVVAPVRDASSYIERFLTTTSDLLAATLKEYEIVLIDACSTDETPAIVESLQRRIKNIQLYCLSRPTSQDIALVAGIDNAIGDFVVTLDPRHDPPELILEMIDLGKRGFDVVYGTRNGRATAANRRLYDSLARRFYKIFSRLTGLYIPPAVSSYRMLSRRVVNYITQNVDRHHLLRVLPAFAGYKQATIPYQRTALAGCDPKAGYSRAILSGIEMIFTVSVTPLRLVTCVALATGILNLLYALYVVAVTLLKDSVAEGWTSLSLQNAGMFFIICLMLAVVSEYIFKVLESAADRPLYHVSKESTSAVIERPTELNVVRTSASVIPEGFDA
jgi:glycosyltransferase involved in cell wall biosynthesis